MDLKKEDIIEMIDKFEAASMTKMSFSCEGISIELEKNAETGAPAAVPAAIPSEAGLSVTQARSSPAGSAGAGGEEKIPQDKGEKVKAPIAGIFYRAPSPGAEPFVKKDRRVKKGDTVGIIEAMKMMNEITAPAGGIVKEINAENGGFVQYGDVLMVIEEE